MVDIEKQIAYWRAGAQDDWASARILIEKGKTSLGLFIAHLAIEKALKALVCRRTNEPAPKDHNLLRLAREAGLTITEKQEDVLSEMNTYNIEGRYPDPLHSAPTKTKTRAVLHRAEGMFEWLIGQ